MLFTKFPKKKVYMGTGLNHEFRSKIIKYLKANAYCFAWSHLNMTCIPLKVAVYKLSLDPSFPPVK